MRQDCQVIAHFWTRKAGRKSHSSCSSSCSWSQFSKGLKIPKAFLIRSRAQRNFAYILADIAVHRSTVSDFSLFSN